MSQPTITEVQEHIILMEGVRYRLADVSKLGLPRKEHQPWCVHCDGHSMAPLEDLDRIHIFDHYCYGHHSPLLCRPDIGLVYKLIPKSTNPGQ